jgi:hypothetical protein
MAIIVVGGHSRSVGKTSVVAGLICALPEYNWTAFKITQYGHGICSRNGGTCDCACADHSWAISEERDRSGESDTSRFLAAGAVRSWWVRTEQGRLVEAMPLVREKLAQTSHSIVESNSVMEFLKPDLYLTVLDAGVADFKNSAQRYLQQADAVLLHSQNGTKPGWSDDLVESIDGKPRFLIKPPDYVTDALVEFVRARLFAHVA